MAVPPAAIMGGQIEGRRDGSFVLVSHRVWGVRRVVLMLGPDLPRQTLVSGFVDAMPEGRSCFTDGGLYSNGYQALGGMYSGTNVHLNVEIDPARGLVNGTLRDYGGEGGAQRISGGPIAGTSFNPTGASSIAAAVGNWTLGDAAARPGHLSVSTDGGLQLRLPECSYSGSVGPVSGLNLLDMSLEAQPGCLLDTFETRGFVVVLPMTDGRKQLLLWGVDNGWGIVVQAIGSR